MTLDELMEQYPLHSRWRSLTGVGEWVIVGYDQDIHLLVESPGYNPVHRYTVERAANWTRIFDAIPCPITEPVTLRRFQGDIDMGGDGFTSLRRDGDEGPSVTLFPPDESGVARWTWEGAEP